MEGPIGPYRIERELGAGNMGVVYQVHHPELDASYAMKVIKSELCDDADLERFRRETEQLAALSDVPAVVGVHSAGELGGRLWYVMDLVQGADLHQLLKREGSFAPRRAARYARDLARGLASVHARGVVHRDIKPANILIDEEDRPRLTDFGLAKTFLDEQNRLTKTGILLGTPLFMAPEQGKHASSAGPPADVYALTMVLFHMIAGRAAVEGNTALEVLINAATGKQRSLRSVAPEAPPALSAICARGLAVEPEDRPTASELADELDRFLEGEADPRRRLPAVAAAVGVVALVAVGLALALRPQPAQVSSAEVVQARVQAWWAAAAPGLTDPSAPTAAQWDEYLLQRRALEETIARVATPELHALQARLLILGGEYALRRDEAGQARELLRAVQAVIEEHPERPMRALRRTKATAALQAGLAVAEGDPDRRGLAYLDQAERAWKKRGWPTRAEFARWRLRLLVLRGEGSAALAALNAADPRAIPPSLRARVLIEAGDPKRALPLRAQLTPDLQAALGFALARKDLAQRRPARALKHAQRATASGGDGAASRSQRAALLAAVKRAERGYTLWSKATDPRVITVGLLKETAYYELRRLLEPSHRVSEPRKQAFAGSLPNALGVLSTEQGLVLFEALLRLNPTHRQLYDLYARQIVKNLAGLLGRKPERLRILAAGYRLADEALKQAQAGGGQVESARLERQGYCERYARALRFLERGAELRALLERIASEEPGGLLEGQLRALLGALLCDQGKRREGLQELSKGYGLAPRDRRVLYAHFFYARSDRRNVSRAVDLARAFVKLTADAKANRLEGGLRLAVQAWLAAEEERRGELSTAARTAAAIPQAYPLHRGWSARWAWLLSRVEPLPTKRLKAALDAIDASWRAAQREPPDLPRSLFRAGKTARLRVILRRLSEQHPPERLPLSPPLP